MSNPDDFIDNFLLHASNNAVYDPQKAREYYLLNRKLKGRQPGSQLAPPAKSKGVLPVSTGIRRFKKQPVLTSVKRQADVNVRVGALKESLKKLESVLQDLLEKAKTKESKKSEPEKSSDKTAQQKDAAAKSSEKYADKNKEEIAAKAKAERDKDPYANLGIEEVRSKIRSIRAQLKRAIGDARSQSSNSKTVKGR